MSGFVIMSMPNGASPSSIERVLSDITAAYERKHLRLTGRIEGDGHVLLLFANQWHDPHRSLTYSPDGSFCTYVGTLIFRGKTSRSATTLLLDEICNQNKDCLNEAYGNFCVIVNDSLGIRVLTDRSGLYHTYHSQDLSLICSSFVGAALYIKDQGILEHEMFQYIFFGATFGRRTLIRNVMLGDPDFEIRLHAGRGSLVARDAVWRNRAPATKLSVEDQLNITIEAADNYYKQLGSAFGDSVTAALSGGYDSRLNLAFLQRHGISPKLFVYGAPEDSDVRIAKDICRGEGLPLEHLNRECQTQLDVYSYWSNQDDVFHCLDGLTQYGFACLPDEVSHRRQRVEGGLLAINGGGGEIWRDYWKLPARSLAAQDFVRVSYAINHSGLMTDPRSVAPFIETFTQCVLDEIGKADSELSVEEVQSLYPRFRLRYWQGKNNSIDNSIGYSVTPFSEHHFTVSSVAIPMTAKRNGWFERQLLISISKRLASYPSAYGFSFLSGPSIFDRCFNATKCSTPLLVRRLFRSVPRKIKFPYYLSAAFRSARFRGSYEVSRYIKLQNIRDPLMLSRALTVERMLRGEWK